MRTFLRLLLYLRAHRGGLIGSLALACAAMGMTVLVPYLVGQAIDAVQRGERPDLLPLAGAIVGAGLLRLALTVARRLIAGRVSLGIEFDLRDAVYKHLQTLELAFFDAHQTGQLMSRATVDLQAIRMFLGYGLVFLTQSLLTIVLAAAVMLALQPGLAALALIPVPFVVAAAARYGRLNRPALQEVQQRIAELTAEAEENISGIRVVKAFARERHQLARFRTAVRRVFDQNVYSTRLRAFYNPLIGFLPQLGLAVVIFVGGRQVISGSLSLGEFAAFYSYVLMLGFPMRMLGMALGMSQRAVASGNRLFEILDTEPRMTSPPDAPPLPVGGGRVRLSGVTLRYDDQRTRVARRSAPEPGDSGREAEQSPEYVGREAEQSPVDAALSDVSLEVEPGARIALVGPTGSGKSSLVALLGRLYDPSEGSVEIDGADLRSVEIASLRSQVALVSEESFLFSATVAENIAYARPQASREQVEAAARRAQAHEFIVALPEGYDAALGERGYTLSGGQRQRIAIARALLADPRILILDDATSSVDARTEAAIRAGLLEAMAGRTTFIVAHRLSTISLADQVLVLDAGRVVDRGTHDELLERCPLYAEIAERGLEDRVFLQRDIGERLDREVASL